MRKDLVISFLEDYFIAKERGYPDLAKDCLELAKTLNKDQFDEKYKEVEKRMKIRMEGGKVS